MGEKVGWLVAAGPSLASIFGEEQGLFPENFHSFKMRNTKKKCFFTVIQLWQGLPGTAR